MSDVGIPCQVYARVVGYYTPVGAWNAGKRQEFAERVTFRVGSDALADAGGAAPVVAPAHGDGCAERALSAVAAVV